MNAFPTNIRWYQRLVFSWKFAHRLLLPWYIILNRKKKMKNFLHVSKQNREFSSLTIDITTNTLFKSLIKAFWGFKIILLPDGKCDLKTRIMLLGFTKTWKNLSWIKIKYSKIESENGDIGRKQKLLAESRKIRKVFRLAKKT